MTQTKKEKKGGEAAQRFNGKALTISGKAVSHAKNKALSDAKKGDEEKEEEQNVKKYPP